MAERRAAALAPVVQRVNSAPMRVPTMHFSEPLMEPSPDEEEGVPKHGKTEPLLKRAGTSPSVDTPLDTSAIQEAAKEGLGMHSGLLQERAKIHLAGGHLWTQYYAVISERKKQLECYDTYRDAKKKAGNKRKYQSWAPGAISKSDKDLRTFDLPSMKECTPVEGEPTMFQLLE